MLQQKQTNFLLITEVNSNFTFIIQHPVSRGKINTDVTELHITLGWHRLWSPTQTLLLHSLGVCCCSQTDTWANHPSIFLAQFIKCLEKAWAVFSHNFYMEATSRWTGKLCTCVCMQCQIPAAHRNEDTSHSPGSVGSREKCLHSSRLWFDEPVKQL